jgi:hypothetical protein
MANIFPDEGISYLFDLIPKNGKVSPISLEVGLFDSHAPNMVPDRFATLYDGAGEMTGAGYQRQTILAASWGTPAIDGNGLLLTATQAVSFGPSVAGDWLPANGFFIAIPVINVVLYYSNFNSGVARTVTQLHKISVTPSIKMGN